MFYPDWKIIEAEKCLEKGTSSNIKEVNLLATALKNSFVKLKPAYEIYKDEIFVKEVLEACLLCENFELGKCSSITGIPELTIEIYRTFFFDTSVFKYKLQKYEYVRSYENANFPDGKLYKQWAVDCGLDVFEWRFRNYSYEPAPKNILNNLMADAFFRAKEHLTESITSPVAKESLRWMKMSLSSISEANKSSEGSDNNLLEEFKIALNKKDTTIKKDTVIDAEIIEG